MNLNECIAIHNRCLELYGADDEATVFYREKVAEISEEIKKIVLKKLKDQGVIA
jgi:ribosomal protein S19E (S16A)